MVGSPRDGGAVSREARSRLGWLGGGAGVIQHRPLLRHRGEGVIHNPRAPLQVPVMYLSSSSSLLSASARRKPLSIHNSPAPFVFHLQQVGHKSDTSRAVRLAKSPSYPQSGEAFLAIQVGMENLIGWSDVRRAKDLELEAGRALTSGDRERLDRAVQDAARAWRTAWDSETGRVGGGSCERWTAPPPVRSPDRLVYAEDRGRLKGASKQAAHQGETCPRDESGGT